MGASSATGIRITPQTLAIDEALAIMGDKYTLAIIERIYQNNAMRFLGLEQGIPGISPRTLSIRLKQMEQDGLIHRQAFAQKPPKVEYTLTDKGLALAHAIQPLARWAVQYPMAATIQQLEKALEKEMERSPASV